MEAAGLLRPGPGRLLSFQGACSESRAVAIEPACLWQDDKEFVQSSACHWSAWSLGLLLSVTDGDQEFGLGTPHLHVGTSLPQPCFRSTWSKK